MTDNCNISKLFDDIGQDNLKFIEQITQKCIERKIGNMNVILQIKTKLELNELISIMTNALIHSGVFENALFRIGNVYEFGFLTKKNRDSFLDKVDINKQALESMGKQIIEENYYTDFSSGKKIYIRNMTDWVNAIQTLHKYTSEIKDIVNSLNRKLTDNEIEEMESSSSLTSAVALLLAVIGICNL